MLRARIRNLSSAAVYRPSPHCSLSARRQTRLQTSAGGSSTSSGETTPVRRFTKSRLMSFKKAQLQEMLSAADLSTEGKKPELVESLLAHYPAATEASAAQPKAQLPVAQPQSKEQARPSDPRAPSGAIALQETEQDSSATDRAAYPKSGPGGSDEKSQHHHVPNLATSAQEAPSVSETSSPSVHSPAPLHSPAARLVSRRRPSLEASNQQRSCSSTASQQAPEISEEAFPECDLRTGMAVQWLGTSSGAPTQQRNVSSILLLQRRRVLMVDCGEGTVNQLATAGVDAALVSGYAPCVHTAYVYTHPYTTKHTQALRCRNAWNNHFFVWKARLRSSWNVQYIVWSFDHKC